MLELPSDWNVEIPDDEDCEEAIAAHHGRIVARQMSKVMNLPWNPEVEIDA